jgi:uncharacterized RDD family membrane protein YckC
VDLKRYKLVKIMTPEATELDFEIGGDDQRIMAFIIDLFIIILLTIIVFGLTFFVFASTSSTIPVAIALVAWFVIRQGYFLISELRRSGTTPGKRNQGLRVVARDGGPLTGEMIVARNLVRDIEFFIPVVVLMAPEALLPNGRGLVVLLAILWLLIFMLMPWFNRYRLRCGDLIAGTVVVRQPKVALLPDIADATARVAKTAFDPHSYTFTIEQLNHYGIKELQVLEDLFRRREDGRATEEILKEVCQKICKRIEWPADQFPEKVERFLHEFYRAQRGHLEQRLLFGSRKEDKHDRSEKNRA